jgi:hypothetical protein
LLSNWEYSDVNQELLPIIRTRDLQNIINYFIYGSPLYPQETENLDVNNDSEVDVIDVAIIKHKMLN